MSITFYLIYAIIGLASVALYLIKRRLSYWKDRGIPHDEPSLFYGNFEGVMRTRSFGDAIQSTYFKFKGSGPFCGFYFFQRLAVMALDKTLIKNVLIRDFSNFVDRGGFSNPEDDPLTAHLFAIDGTKWRILRTKLSPTFTSGKMKFMFPTIVKVADEFVSVFDEMLNKGNVIEIKELLARFSTDVIGTCAFGIECNSLKDPNAEFRVIGRRALFEKRHCNFVNGLMEGFPDLARKLHMRLVLDDVHNFFLRIVRETVDYRIQHNVQKNDFLSLLIDLKDGKTLSKNDTALKGLSIEEMAAQAFVFFIAGFETSSTTLGFALLELAQNHEIQDRLRNEVHATFKRHHNEFNYDCLNEMPYMEQVIAETLRKYTIVPFLNRLALNDYPIPGHPKYIIPKGAVVIIPTAGIHHDPEIYPDPDKFDPERFTPEQVQQRDSVYWLPFGDGPRNCIGLRFGQMQMRIGLAYLIKHFRFSVCADTEIQPEIENDVLLLSSKNGIYLKVERTKTDTFGL